jgi:hypothetical protein
MRYGEPYAPKLTWVPAFFDEPLAERQVHEFDRKRSNCCLTGPLQNRRPMTNDTRSTASTATSVDTPIKTIDDTGANLPVTAFTEAAFEVPKPVELPSERWRRRGWRSLLPLVATTAVASVGLSIVTRGTDGSGLGPLALVCVPFVIGTLMSLFPTKSKKHPLGASVGLGVFSAFLATLLTLPLLREGAICLVFAIPVTMGLTALSGTITVKLFTKWMQRLDDKARAALGLIIALLLPLSANPLDHALFFDANDRADITTVQQLPWSQEHVWNSLRHLEITFDKPAPNTLAAMLPIPRALVGDGVDLGAVRRVEFDNGVVVATVVELDAPRHYAIDLKLENPGREFFNHWLDLQHSVFDLTATGPSSTTLVHTTTYRPLLYPRWAFAGLEQTLGTMIQQNLVDTYANEVLSPPPPPAQVAARE